MNGHGKPVYKTPSQNNSLFSDTFSLSKSLGVVLKAMRGALLRKSRPYPVENKCGSMMNRI